MANGYGVGPARMPPKPPKIPESDFTFGIVRSTLQVLDYEDLKRASDTVATLSDAGDDEPFDKYNKERLLSFLIGCAENLRERDPEMLSVVRFFLDAIERARYKKLLRAES